MVMQLSRRSLIVFSAAVAASVAALTARARGITHARTPAIVEWDDLAASEVKTLLHQMHHAWNERDVDFIRDVVAPDAFMGSFELTADEEPTVLNSRDELLSFVDTLFGEMERNGRRSEASPQVVHQARATSTFAICTEECDLVEYFADGSRHVLPHRATSAVRKGLDGWKFMHWHVSQGGPGKRYDADGNLLTKQDEQTS
jgi:hypothetical protein